MIGSTYIRVCHHKDSSVLLFIPVFRSCVSREKIFVDVHRFCMAFICSSIKCCGCVMWQSNSFMTNVFKRPQIGNIFFRMYYFIEYSTFLVVMSCVLRIPLWNVSTNCLIHHVTSNYSEDGTISVLFTLWGTFVGLALILCPICSHLHDEDARLHLLDLTKVSFQFHTRANRNVVPIPIVNP